MHISRNQRIERLIDRVGSMVSELEDIRSELWNLLPRKPPTASDITIIVDAAKRYKNANATEQKFRKQAQLDFGFISGATWPPTKETLRIKLPKQMTTLQDRLLSSIVVLGDCWIWEGSDSGIGRGGGYPRITWRGQTWAVHRLSLFAFKGIQLKPRQQAGHVCPFQNPPLRLCIHPDHIQPMSHKRNQQQRVKQQIARGAFL